MGDRCRWIKDPSVPKGRFLVPGCWSRAVYGEDAECHCLGAPEITDRDRIDMLEQQVAELKKQMSRRLTQEPRDEG